ncbi:MAG: TonB-dependent receptor [Gammaproteobacteria bacterium]
MKAHAIYPVMLSITASSGVFAQDQPNEAPTLSEVTVTAQRQTQNIQDVPISITAFSQEEMQQNGLSEVKDYFMFTPNVSFTEDGENGERSVGISIRGVSDFASSLTNIGALSSSFGIYLDEFNVANSAVRVSNPELQDLQSVEVLRGPQGTYFGRNATGGALNLTTALPNDKTFYELSAGYGSFSTWNVSLVANVPLADNFFVRGVAWQEQSAGFIKNLSPTGNDASYFHSNVRASARWLVNDKITADLSLMQTRSDDGADTNVNSGVLDVDTLGATPNVLPADPLNNHGLEKVSIIPDFRNRVHVPIGPAIPVDSGKGFFPNNTRYINKDFYETNVGKSTTTNLRLNYEGEGWSVRSITGYLDSEFHRAFDQDVTQVGLYETYAGRVSGTFSQELRLHVQNERIDWTAGGLYARDASHDFNVSPIGPDGFAFATLNPNGTIATCSLCLFPGMLIGNKALKTLHAKSYAMFTDLAFKLTPKVTLTGGLRYTHDNLTFKDYNAYDTKTFEQVSNGDLPDDSDIALQAKKTFSDVTPRLVLAYKPRSNINTYVLASAGYKPGGVVLNTASEFDKERLLNYEAGIKMDAFERRLQVNVAAFFMDWKNMQIPTLKIENTNGAFTLEQRILNVDAHSSGLEFEVKALPSEHLFLGAGIGYLKAKFDGFGPEEPFIFNKMAFDLDGDTLPRSPEWTLNAVGQFNFKALKQNDAFVRLEWSYRSETTSDVEAVATLQQPLNLPGFNTGVTGAGQVVPFPREDFPFRVPAFDLWNLRAGLSGDRWSLVAFAENLLDKDYYTGTQENFGLGGIRIRPHHRTFGIQFRLRGG